MRNKAGKERTASPFRWMLKRYVFLAVAVTLITFAMFPMQGTMRVLSTRQAMDSFPGPVEPQSRAFYVKELTLDYVYSPLNLEIICLILGGMGFGAAMVLFRHLFSRKRGMMIAALPHTRTQDFLRRAGVYAVWCLAPMAVCQLIHPIMVRAYGLWEFFDLGLYLRRAGAVLLINLYGYTLGVLCASVFGTVWSAALGGMLIAGSAEAAAACWVRLAGAYLSTMYQAGTLRRLIRLSPVYTLYKGFYAQSQVSILPGVTALILFAVLGWLAYHRVKPEHAGQTVSMKGAEPALTGWTAALGGTAGAILLVLYLTREPLMYLGMVLGAAAAWLMTRMLLDQRIRLDFRKWKVPAAVTAVMLLGLVGLRMDWFGYETWAPDVQRLAEISATRDMYRDDRAAMRFTDPESIQAAAEWTARMRKEMQEERRENPFQPSAYGDTIVVFRDANGSSVTRQYRLPEDQQAVLPALRVMAEAAEKQKSEELPNLPRVSCYSAMNSFGIQGADFQQAFGFSMTVEQYSLDPEKIREAVRKDLQARTLDTLQQPPLLRLSFEGMDPELGYYVYGGDYAIRKGDLNTLEAVLGENAEKWMDYADGGFAENAENLVFLCEYTQDEEENRNLSSWKLAESPEEAREWMTHVTCCDDRFFRMPVEPSRQVQVYGLKRLRENLRFMDDPDLDLDDPETLKNLPSFENVGCQTYRWILGE